MKVPTIILMYAFFAAIVIFNFSRGIDQIRARTEVTTIGWIRIAFATLVLFGVGVYTVYIFRASAS